VRQCSRGKVGILFAYITRRFGMMLLIVFGASYLAYNLQAITSNPLAVFAESDEENKDFLIARTIRELDLNVPPPLRYFIWLRGILGLFVGQFDPGQTRDGFPVWDAIALAIPTTFRLVIASTILAIILGISIGLVTAMRQYSRFDYVMTFISFLLFSLPVFWVAALLKEYMAIGFNDFLVQPEITPPFLIGFSLFAGVTMAGIMGGSRNKALTVFLGVSALTGVLLQFMSLTKWFTNPGLGFIGVAVLTLGFAVLVAHISSGLENRKALWSSLGAALSTIILYYPISSMLVPSSTLLTLVLTFAALAGAASIFAFFMSKVDRHVNIRTALITSVFGFSFLIVDRFMREFNAYMYSDAVNGRPVPTISQSNDLLTDAQRADFWVSGLDVVMHLVLPTIALTLISFAGYVRFSRGSLLEVLNMDYIRTARAKGLTERTVIVRHALRNAMLPLTTILVNDFAGVIGGAIITEGVFGWKGMGQLFNDSIRNYDLNLFMGVFIISATLTVLANLVADLLFGVVDPRIRLRK
jgi:peptide/nickel transport system permease protein